MIIKIIANFPAYLLGEAVGRFTFIAQTLHERGHSVEMIVSDFDHLTKAPRIIEYEKYPFKITAIHERGYKGNVSVQRLISHYFWGKRVGSYLRGLAERPDVVYAAIPSLTAARQASRYCKKVGAIFIIDIQDLWPEAFKVALKSKLIAPFFIPFDCYANGAYKDADIVIGVSDTYRNRGLRVNRKGKNELTVFIGNDAEKFDAAKTQYAVAKPDSEYWLAYVGAMGYSYDLHCAIDAISIATQRKPGQSIKLVAMGAGPLLEEYRNYAQCKGVHSEFTGPLPYAEMVGLLCSCDATVNCLRPGAAQSITNKVGDYALSGLPVINTQENEEYRKIVEKYKCGINCKCGDAEEVANALVYLMDHNKEAEEMGRNSRRLGLERFDRPSAYKKIINVIENQQ